MAWVAIEESALDFVFFTGAGEVSMTDSIVTCAARFGGGGDWRITFSSEGEVEIPIRITAISYLIEDGVGISGSPANFYVDDGSYSQDNESDPTEGWSPTPMLPTVFLYGDDVRLEFSGNSTESGTESFQFLIEVDLGDSPVGCFWDGDTFVGVVEDCTP